MMRILTICSWIILLAINWFLIGSVLWWSYDMTSLVKGGFYNYDVALSLVLKMGLILTTMTAAVWVARKKCRNKTERQAVWTVSWQSALLGIVYVSLALMRRELWRPDQKLSDDSMFLPIVGHVNAQFFSETGWLSFLLLVVPAMGAISGLLYHFQNRISKLYEEPR